MQWLTVMGRKNPVGCACGWCGWRSTAGKML